MTAESIVAYAKCGDHKKAILANHLAPRPEYFGLVRHRGSFKRYYATTVQAVANRLKRDAKWTDVTIEWL